MHDFIAKKFKHVSVGLIFLLVNLDLNCNTFYTKD